MTLELLIALCAFGASALAAGGTAIGKAAKKNNAEPAPKEQDVSDLTENRETAVNETAEIADSVDTVDNVKAQAEQPETEDTLSEIAAEDNETLSDTEESVEQIIVAETSEVETESEKPLTEKHIKVPEVSDEEENFSVIKLRAVEENGFNEDDLLKFYAKSTKPELDKYIDGEPAIIMGEYGRFTDEDFRYLKERAKGGVPFGDAGFNESPLRRGETGGEPVVRISASEELIYRGNLEDGVFVKPVAQPKAAVKEKPEAKSEVKPVNENIGINTEEQPEGAFHEISFGVRIPFKDKILGADKAVKSYYDIINNEFLSYKKVSGRVSISCASYRFGRNLLAKITYRGKTMKLHLALNVKEQDENVFHQKDFGDVKAYEEVPFTVKVKSDRGAKNAVSLIEKVCGKYGAVKKANFERIDSIKALKEI